MYGCDVAQFDVKMKTKNFTFILINNIDLLKKLNNNWNPDHLALRKFALFR